MSYDDAKATIAEAQEIRACRPLTVSEGLLALHAIYTIQHLEGMADEKVARRERWARRKAESKARFWDRYGHE
jgi:hypothetical protein